MRQTVPPRLSKAKECRRNFKKSLPVMNGDVIIGFMDESSPQTTANTQRLWSFGKPTIYKNTDKIKANAFGCYMLNGTSVIDFKEHSKKEDVGEFLITIREKNPSKEIVIFCDNFNSHRADYTKGLSQYKLHIFGGERGR
jgi:hypothetical protein